MIERRVAPQRVRKGPDPRQQRFNELWRVAFGTSPPSVAIANVTCEGAVGQQCLRTRDHRSVGVNQIVDSHLHGEKVCWQGCDIVPAARR